jgi:hypothetical protein
LKYIIYIHIYTSMHICVYANNIMKPLTLFKKGQRKDDKKVIEGVNLIKVHFVHLWKYHNSFI